MAGGNSSGDDRSAGDFDDRFPDFDPAAFEDHYPTMGEYPPPFWQEAMRRVYDRDLYQIARDPAHSWTLRMWARTAWGGIEHGDEVTNLIAITRMIVAAFLPDFVGDDNVACLSPRDIGGLLTIVAALGFREYEHDEYARRMLHRAIEIIDVDRSQLSVAAAMQVGYALGRAEADVQRRVTEPPPPLVE